MLVVLPHLLEVVDLSLFSHNFSPLNFLGGGGGVSGGLCVDL